MSLFVIDHVTTYRKYCKSGKGEELAMLLPQFERRLMNGSVYSDFEKFLRQKINALNVSYPRTKPFCIKKVDGSLYIQPEVSTGVRSFENDYVAVIGVKRVQHINSTADLQDLFRQFNDSMAKKGGKR